MVLVGGIAYLEWRKRTTQAAGKGYGTDHKNELEIVEDGNLPNPLLATLSLVSVLVVTLVLQK